MLGKTPTSSVVYTDYKPLCFLLFLILTWTLSALYQILLPDKMVQKSAGTFADSHNNKYVRGASANITETPIILKVI